MSLLTPEQALALWRLLRADAPTSIESLRRLTKAAPVWSMIKRRVYYYSGELTRWLLGPRAYLAIRLLDISEAAAALDFDTVPDPPQSGDQRTFMVALVDADAVVYRGSLEGAELWLRREAEARAEAEGGGL